MKKQLSTLLIMLIAFSTGWSQTVIEAEDFTLSGDATVTTNQSASGGSHVALNKGTMSYTFSSESDKYYDIYIHASYPGQKYNYFVIDGNSGSFGLDAASDGYITQKVGSFTKLAAGSHIFEINAYWGYINIDYITVEEVDPSNRFNLNQSLVTPNATDEAQRLYQFLLDNYGRKIISGAMTLREMDMITKFKNMFGKEPALAGIDFIFENQGYTWFEDGTLAKEAQAWYERNGIPAICWHWIDPMKKGGAFYYKTGLHSSDGTEFDANAIFNVGTPEYDSIISNMDYVAEQFKTLQDNGVPIVWRPLHEASGGWFWWGAKGPEPCVELWKVMYDRFVNHHGLKNLIWVYTHQAGESADWYPGDEYVDIVGMDIYKTGDHTSQIMEFNNVNSVYNGTKIIAETECGSFPDPDNLIEDGAAWSWFMPWYDSPSDEFLTGSNYNPTTFWEKVIDHDYVIMLDEMPDLKTYVSPAGGNSDLEFLNSSLGVFTEDFDAATTEYSLEIPEGADIPTISGTAVSGTATVTVTQAESVPGTATVEVKSGDGTSTSTYTVSISTYTPIATIMEITPTEAKVYLNESLEFTAKVYDQNDIEMNETINWSVDGGGSMSNASGTSSTFTSNGTEGEYTLTVSAGSVTETVTISVTEAPVLMILEGEDFAMADGAVITDVTEASNGKVGSLKEGSMTLTFTTEEEGIYNIAIYSVSPYGEKQNTMTIDGTDYTVAQSNTDYEMVEITKGVTLAAGNHTISFTASWGWIDIDYVQFELQGANKLTEIIEAEDFTLTDGSAIANLSTASNEQIVNLMEGNMSYKFKISEDAYYDFYIYATSAEGDKENNFVIDGSSSTFATTENTEYQLVKIASNVMLAAGEHSMEILKSWGWIDIDYIKAVKTDLATVTQTITLTSGWNLVSTYITPDDDATESVFSCSTVVKDFWEFYWTEHESYLNSLETIEAGRGYMVYAENGCTSEITGYAFSPKAVPLNEGWNIIGFPFSTNKTVESALTPITSYIEVIKDMDTQWSPDGTNTMTELESGKAYYIKVNADCTLSW